MLTANYLVNVAAPMVDLWGQVEADILADIARRLVKGTGLSDTSRWQTLKLREMGVLQTDIASSLAANRQKQEKALYKMIVDACREALKFDDAIYRGAGMQPGSLAASKALMDVISAGIRKTNGLMANFTNTTALDASKAFSNALDRAWLQVNSGAFSYDQALRGAIRDLAEKGIGGVAYPSGHHDKMDVAARRALITGLNQTVGDLQLARADEMECDLVEVTSHAGARPTHAVWQGQVYSRSGKHPHYKDFYAETGYGTGDGLCGWNCYHSFYPFFEGLSHQAFERDPAARIGKSNDQVYEESQEQRYYERQIREAKRECVTIDAARKATDNPELKAALDSDFSKASVRLKSREAKLDAFCRETGRTKLSDRTSVYGYNRSVSGKAVGAASRHYRQFAKDYNILPEIKSLKEYYDLKANNPREFSWLKEYTRSVDKGMISPLVGFDVFRRTAREADKELVGLKTADGLEIKGFVPHFVTRLIGQTADPYPGKRQGVTVAEAKTALLGVAMPDKRRLNGELSRKYIGGGALVTVNPDKGLLIQTNHKGV